MPFLVAASPDLAKQAWPLMDEREHARASSFHFTRDRERYCQSQLLVRCVLSRYLDVDPAKIAIVEGPHGKPLIDNPGENRDLHFNLAHCQSVALLAVTSGQSVGIDVEDGASIRKADFGGLAREFLTKREAQIIRALAGAERDRAFLRCWTRKEALLKAIGLGLIAKLDGFEVPLDEASSWRVSGAPDNSSDASTFEMVDLSEGDIFAAVAATRIVGPVELSDFEDVQINVRL